MPQQSGLQSRKQRHPLLAQGRQVTSDTAESRRPRQTAETARDFLLDFDHPNIALGQIVG